MALEDLNEKLYGRDIHLDRARQHTPFDPDQVVADQNVKEQFQKEEVWQAPVVKQEIPAAALLKHKRRKRIAILLGVVALLAITIGVVIKVRGMLFNEERVLVSIVGPKDVASVEETTFTVTYANNNWAGLSNASLILSYPETFHLQAESTMKVNGSLTEISIGDIPANAQGKISFKGKFYGSKGEHLNLQAKLKYSPNKVSTVLEKVAQLEVTVASAPLSVEVTAPIELAAGQEIEYLVEYSNKSDQSFSNLRVKVDYPDGFHLTNAEPRPSEGDGVWYVGNFDPGAKGKIVLHGVLSGTQEEYKRVRGMIGFFQGDGTFASYGENERQTHIIASPLSISQTVNSLTDTAVYPGESLAYAIHYRNDGNIGVRDAIVTLEIDPTLLDISRLELSKGAYDAARKIIIWKASDEPSLGRLEPGAEGEIDFSVPVSSKVTSSFGTDLSVKTIAKIDSLDIPTPIGANKIIGSNTLYVKLKSSADIVSKALYTDTTFANSGPIPPKVGQETSYTIHLNVTNSLNDVKNARIVAILPTWVHYNQNYVPKDETVMFNERNNELVWELGTLSPAAGKSRELIFQVAVTPSPNQAGAELILLSNMTFTGRDEFANQDIRFEKDSQRNDLGTDPVYGVSHGGVSVVQKAD